MKELMFHPESNSYFTVISPSGVDYDQACATLATNVPAGTQVKTALSHSTVRPSIDFETYSEAGFIIDYDLGTVKGAGGNGKSGLPVVGTPVYAEHPSTDVLCLYYDLKDGKGVRGWIPGLTSLPSDLLQHVASGGDIAAHNVTFEWYIWNLVCVRKYGFPPLQLEQCYCDMAKARRHSLPGSLGKLAEALGTADKDKQGVTLLRKLSRPHKPTKSRKEYRWLPHTAWADFQSLYDYCAQDVVAEDEAAVRVPDLTESERDTWLADQRVNARGVQLDTTSLDACRVLLEATEKRFTVELAAITQGAVGSVSEVAKILNWLRGQGVRLPDLTADTVKDALELPNLTAQAKRVLRIRQALGSANVKKIHAFKLQTSSDGRLRDQYMYCGADRTGRWSSGGVQLQNLTSKGPKSQKCAHCGRITGKDHTLEVMGSTGACPNCGGNSWEPCLDWTVEAVEWALYDINREPIDNIIALWGDPVTLIAGCLRGLLVAPTGKDLICADFSAIEAVVLACISRCQWRIDVFNTHGKIYEMSASKITAVPFEEFAAYKKANGTHHPLRKSIGKVAELASGYGGWVGAWKAFGADEHFKDDAEIKGKILAWREASPEIVEFWGGQFKWCGPGKWDYRRELFGLEGAAIAAIQNPGQCFQVIDVSFGVYDDVLYCRLPSGRFLHYHRPQLYEKEDNLKRGMCYGITFWGYNSNAQKGPVGWTCMETYGGRLCENVVQAISADIQAEAMKNAEAAGYPVVMHTHDELTAEVPEGFGSVEELCSVMEKRPDWASWWPIRAAGWRHKRYQKD